MTAQAPRRVVHSNHFTIIGCYYHVRHPVEGLKVGDKISFSMTEGHTHEPCEVVTIHKGRPILRREKFWRPVGT